MKTSCDFLCCLIATTAMVPAVLLAMTSPVYAQTSLPAQACSTCESQTPAGWFVAAADYSPGDAEAQPSPGQDPPPASAGDTQDPNSVVNGPNDWVHRWLRGVDKARSEQPHYVAPLITTHVLLVQQFRFDSYYQTAHMGGEETDNYGAMHGLEIIPNTRMEVQVGIPPYMFHQAPNMPDGFGDVSIFLKFRVVSAPEGKGGYFFGFFLGGEFPSGTAPNGMGHTIWTPMVAGAKRWGFFDWQTNFAGMLPQSGTAMLGRQIIFNNTFQFSIHNKLWPELEDNTTFIVDGPKSGNTENFLTPGLLIGPFRIAERLHFEPGAGIQIATTSYYSYNHRWIWTVRFPF